MSSREPTAKTDGEEHGSSSTTDVEAEQTLVGDAFPDSSTLPAYATTEPCITHPLQNLNNPQLTTPVLSHAILRNPTPRPHSFPSLEAARDHVYRKPSDARQASRNPSGEISQTPSEDDPSLGDMSQLPSTRAFGRSLTGHAPSQSPALPALPVGPARGFTPITRPVIWENVPKPLNTSSSRNVSSSQMSGSSVDNIIAQYGQQSSSAAQSLSAVFGGSSSMAEVDRFIGQNQGDVPLNVGIEPCLSDGVALGLEGSEFRANSKIFEQPVPPGPPPSRAPLHPSNPFFKASCPDATDITAPEPRSKICPAGPSVLLRETQTPPIDHSQAKFASGRGVGSVTGSETVSVAESKVGPLNSPSNAMHSVRRQRRGRQSPASYNTHSSGGASEGTGASGVDEDPFKYDRHGPILHPSRERVVSAHLRLVRGLPRESTATVYSQDGTPSRTFYGEAATDSFDKNGQSISPRTDRLQCDLFTVQTPSRNPFMASRQGHHSSANVTRSFYDPDAINPDWASGKPDIVRVPVTKKGNLFGGTQRDPGVGSSLQPDQEVGLEALRRRQGENRITGNTDDWETMCDSEVGPSMKGAGLSLSSQQGWMLGYEQCGSSIADISDKDLPTQNFMGFEAGPFQEDGLVHPPRRGEDSLPGRSIFRPREIRGTPAPIFIPEQRDHRVNGLFTNNSRGFRQNQGQRLPPASRLPPVRDLFRSGSQKRPPIAKFPPHQSQPSGFEFSRLRSMEGGQSYLMQSLTPHSQTQQQATRTIRHNHYGLVSPNSPLSVFPFSRQRVVTVESDDSFNQSLVESPFLSLIPLEQARKNAASRRASGKDEDAVPILAAHGAAAQRAIRNISNTSNVDTVVAAPPAVATPLISRFASRAIAKHADQAMATQDSTRPTISTIDDSGQLIHTITYPDGSRSYMFDPEPRLVSWDQRHRRGLAPQSTDRSLQQIQRGQRGLRSTGRVRYSDDSAERWISRDADEKRRAFFLYTAFFSIFPFISIIALCGGFNATLSWTTHGEVHRFSRRQMNFLMLEAVVGLITWISIIVFVVLKIH